MEKLPIGSGRFKRVQREIGLRELSLPQPRSEGIDGIIAARNVFSKAELG